MTIEAISIPDAIDASIASLRLGESQASDVACFELLRSIVWCQSRGQHQVHIAKILNAGIPVWRLMCGRRDVPEKTLREELSSALKTLQEVGDLIEAPGGRWLSATTRRITNVEMGIDLIVGGAPNSALPFNIHTIRHHGPYRHLTADSIVGPFVPCESLPSWARLPETTLSEWAAQMLSSLRRLPYTPTSSESFDFYQPETARAGVPQYRRWSEQLKTANGTFLAMRKRIYNAKEYRIVDVEDGRISRICEFPSRDARRMMYALDCEARNPVVAIMSAEKHETMVLLKSEIPSQEKLVFAALGKLSIPSNRPFERRWIFKQPQVLVLKLLKSLGITIHS